MNNINDGTVQFGSREVTLGAKGVFETDDFKIDQAVTDFVRTNYVNTPTGQVAQKGVFTASATLQLATGATSMPVFGDQVTVLNPVLDSSYGSAVLYVKKVGRAETKNGEIKVPVEFLVSVTASVTVS